MSNDGEFTMELFGIDGNPEDEGMEIVQPVRPLDDEEEISEEELEARLQTATEEEINAYNDDGIIPPLRESANANLPTEPEAEKPAKKERKKRQPKEAKVADEMFHLPGGKGLRPELQKEGLTEVDAIGEIQSNQIESIEGFIAWPDFSKVLREAGLPAYRAIRVASGGARGLLPPLEPRFRIHWHGKRRYFKQEVCSPEALERLRQALADKPKKEAKPKKERKAKADAIPQEVAPPQETLADLSKVTLVNWLKNAVPDANVNKNMSKAQLLTIVEENGLTMKDYFTQS